MKDEKSTQDEIQKNEEIKKLTSKSIQKMDNIKEKEIQMIIESVINKISANNSKVLEPKKKVLEKKISLIIVQIIGWLLLISCIYRWLIYFFIYEYYRPLTDTTYLTLIFISFTCINKFESVILNSLASISFLLFIFVSILFIPLTTNILSFIEGLGLHFTIVVFQLYLLFNKKIVISKKYLIWSFLLYLIFISSYDSFVRINAAVEMTEEIPEILTTVIIFYVLGISTLVIYFYKKKFGILLP